MDKILPRLKKLLKKYPYFLEKRNSNLYKHATIVNNQFLDIYSTIKILDLARDIERPITIHKIQNIEHNYIIKVNIKIDNLKKFSFYKTNGINNELLFETNFDKSTNSYSYNFESKSETIIPEDKFFVIIETYDEYLFVKGFS